MNKLFIIYIRLKFFLKNHSLDLVRLKISSKHFNHFLLPYRSFHILVM